MTRGLKIFSSGFILGCLATLVTGFLLWDPPQQARDSSLSGDAVTATRVQIPPDNSANFTRTLTIPVSGVSAANLRDSFDEIRGATRKHQAIDILAPRGTPVVAADDGAIKKLFVNDEGGIALYHFDPTERYAYYYGHLDRYADVREGMIVKRGDVIAYVGSTGNAPPNTPHLHFGIFRLGPEKNWWMGDPVNPYPILIAQAR